MEAAGATTLCNKIANSGWDFVGFSEDFNFHSELTAAPASTYYNFGAHGGSVSGLSNSTDGLGFACDKRFTMAGGTKVAWSTYYGGSSNILDALGENGPGKNGADEMINKGFRMYTVTLATGIAVDVYVLHMDAGTADEGDSEDLNNGKDRNIIAREAQLKQLADYIKDNHNNRPVIILGDTNCRYTREQLKTGFIDYINADSRLTINDPWVDLMWGGAYPAYGSDDMMTHTYGMQRGEIVDKVFYINTTASNLTLKANSYLHDESVNVSEHKPVVVNFTLTDPNGTANSESDWTISSSESQAITTGCKVTNGGTYFLKNVGSGTYLKSGATWGTQAAEGSAGLPITFELVSGNVYSLKTTLGGYMGHNLDSDNPDYPYMDVPTAREWTLTPVYGDDENGYQYQLISSAGNALATGSANHDVYCVEQDVTSNDQKWILLTEDDIRRQMTEATTNAPYNITPLLKAADFDVKNTENNTTNWGNGFSYCTIGGIGNGTPADYNYSAMINSTANAVSISQTISNLPAGQYQLSFEGFYRYILTTTTKTETVTETRTATKKAFSNTWTEGSWVNPTTSESANSTSTEQTMTSTVQFGSASTTLAVNNSVGVGDINNASITFRNNDTYLTVLQGELGSTGGLTVNVSKPSTTADSSEGPTTGNPVVTNGTPSTNSFWSSGTRTDTRTTTTTTITKAYSNSVFIDNFKLLYFGNSSEEIDPNLAYREELAAHVNATAEKVKKLNSDGQAAYDISAVIYRYNNDMVTGTSLEPLKAMVDNAYTNAYLADHATTAKEAIANMTGNNYDLTAAIINPSFEKGDDTGWTYNIPYYNEGNPWGEFGAYTYGTTGMDGSYVFNNYSFPTIWWGWAAHSPVSQTITNVPNGLYRLTALVASDEGRNVYVVGENYYAEAAAINANTFAEISVDFLVENGSATIKACASNTDINNGAYYWPDGGWWYKADNFRLTYLCDEAHGRVKLAMDKAKATPLDIYGADAFDISDIEDKYNNGMVSDGVADAQEITDRLRAAAKRQNQAGADMTAAIVNPSFETGDLTGWEVETVTDTKVVPQSNATYAVLDADGRYLFNNWNGDGENDIDTPPITQTITDIVNGTYRLTAKVASHADRKVYLIANDKVSVVTTTDKTRFVTATVEFTVTNNTATIGVVGGDINDSGAYNEAGGGFYKCDDFQLTLVTPSQLRLYQDAGVVEELNDVTYPAVVMNRPIKAKDSKGNAAWASFVAPFDIPAFDGWDYMKLTGATYNAGTENLSLQFSKVATIEAGVPYMVRCTTLTETLPQIEMGETSVNTVTMEDTKVTITDGNGSTVTFKGVYTAGKVPQGAFFISDNTFYRAADNTNTLKGFRGYIQIDGSLANKARSMSFRWDDGTTSIDDGQLTNDNEVTTVAIYNERGMRLTEMQQGINILLMSDGSVVKIMVK